MIQKITSIIMSVTKKATHVIQLLKWCDGITGYLCQLNISKKKKTVSLTKLITNGAKRLGAAHACRVPLYVGAHSVENVDAMRIPWFLLSTIPPAGTEPTG